ncbi:MAG TPA: response regulator transcription factor [Thermoanaerobaculia bacterium]
MKILVADDHQIVRKGLQLIIARRPDWLIAAEAANAAELYSALAREHFDVLVLDLRLGGVSGVDVLRSIRHEHAHLPVLMLSMHPEEQYAMHCLRAGASGYVQKDATADEILDAIERVASGRRWVSTVVAEQLANELAHPHEGRPHERLSIRESEVFRRLAIGETVTAISKAMQLSVKTVSTYRTRILEKTGFQSNADIVAYAIRNNLL